MDRTLVKAKLEAARRLKQQQLYAEAEKELLQALDAAPRDAAVRVSLADVYYHLQRYREARHLIEGVLKDYPRHLYALYLAGLIAYRRRLLPEALDYFRAVLQMKPDYLPALKMALTVFIKQKEWDEAFRMAGRALALQPDDPYLLSQTARVYREKGNPREALALLEKIVQKGEDNEFVRKQILELKAQLAGKSEKEITREMASVLKQAEQRNRPEVWQIQAENLRREGRLAEAAEAYQQLLRLEPENEFALRQLAYIYKKLGDREKAAEYLTQLFLKNPGDPVIRNSLYAIYRQTYSLSDWIKLLREALQLHPDYSPLYGLIKKYRARSDALANLKMSAGEFAGQLSEIEFRRLPPVPLPATLKPVHQYLINSLVLGGRVLPFDEFMGRLRRDSRLAHKLKKSWTDDFLRFAYQYWLFWIHFYLLSREMAPVAEAMYRLALRPRLSPVVWEIRRREVSFEPLAPGARVRKSVVKDARGVILRIPPDYRWSGRSGDWVLATGENLQELASWLKTVLPAG